MEETGIPHITSDDSKCEKFPLLPITAKNPYASSSSSSSSNSRIYSSFSTYFSKSWIPPSLRSTISKASSTISHVFSCVPSTHLFYLSTRLSSLMRRRNRKLLFIISQLFFTFAIYRYSNAGPFLPLSCQVIGLGCPTVQATGFTTPQFSGVQRIFENNFRNGLDIGAGVSVYYDNKLVVDLQGGIADLKSGTKYDEDTLQLVFSCTKVLVSYKKNFSL